MKDEKIKRILTVLEKFHFLTNCQELTHLYMSTFLKDTSKRVNLYALEIANDGLSFEIFRSNIKSLVRTGTIRYRYTF